MNAAPTPATEDLIPLLSRNVIETIADRPNESETSRQARAQCAMRLIEGFKPKDGVEIMLAGQFALFLSLVLDSIHDAQHATTEDMAFKHRQQSVALARVQLSYATHLDRRIARRLKAELKEAEVQTRASTSAPPAPMIPFHRDAQSRAKTIVVPPAASTVTAPGIQSPAPQMPPPIRATIAMPPAPPAVAMAGPPAGGFPLRGTQTSALAMQSASTPPDGYNLRKVSAPA
ncbi:MAG: hypothetical protein EXR07_18125 [Acetobacteraceae bacterium]|nr:hypothetical protein [Acetobacteraceae bacterium]